MIPKFSSRPADLVNGASSFAALLVLAALAGCASNSPAPIVHRTTGTESTQAQRDYYTVGRGDTIVGISQRFGVSIKDLIEFNNLPAQPVLQAGQVLRLRPLVDPSVAKPSVPTSPSDAGQAQTGPIRQSPPTTVTTVPAVIDSPKLVIKTSPKGLKRPYTDATYTDMAKGIDPSQPVSTNAPAVAAVSAVPMTAGPATSTPTSTPPSADQQSADKIETRSDGSGLAWAWPASGKVLQTFDGQKSRGVVIVGEPGKPVMAAANGKVLFAKEYLDYGKLVIISHSSDVVSVYAQNNTISIKEGQTVTRGQKIAEQGPRLQFEVRRNGKAVDPTQYLPSR